MTMYLLLRNNKQSGPYSLEEMKSMGLKAYDLVWLEGRSAAWRYPCEIEELSAFAPAVEEQPFDRFYKRPASSDTTTVAAPAAASMPTSITTAANVTAIRPAAEAPANGTAPTMPGKRIIYVNLPSGRPATASLREIPTREAARETPYATPRDVPRETEKPRVPAGTPAPASSTIPLTSEIDDLPSYSSLPPHSSLPPYSSRVGVSSVEFMPRRRSPQKEKMFRILAVGVCILALLSAGIFIGLSLNKETLGLQRRIASQDRSGTVPPAHTATQPQQSSPSGSAANTAVLQKPTGPAGDAAAPSSTRTPRSKRLKGKPAATVVVLPPVTKDSAPADIPLIHREAVHRTDVAAPAENNDKDAIRSAIADQVSVGGNKYNVGTFGGINDLQLTVTNRSVYPLDLVVVEVQYIQANKKIYKTEDLYFRDIGPGAALMQEAPKSSRGIRVAYKITSISSTKLGLSYSGL